jgi:hypothetical protein
MFLTKKKNVLKSLYCHWPSHYEEQLSKSKTYKLQRLIYTKIAINLETFSKIWSRSLGGGIDTQNAGWNLRDAGCIPHFRQVYPASHSPHFRHTHIGCLSPELTK